MVFEIFIICQEKVNVMEKLIWNNDFSVGVQELDEQHKKIIEIENRLIKAKDVEIDSETLSDILSDLTKYISEHFESEEKLFYKYNYPDYSSHRAQHNLFRKQIAKFCIDAMYYKSTVPIELLTFLEEWWKNHTQGSDMKYKAFFSELGLKLG